jgi:outer membrane protein assembly factor BamE (lipoprotein component of BamABCDE complex)
MSKDKLVVLWSLLLVSLLLSGCMIPAQHQKSLHSTQEREMTLGIVQKELRAGMSQADVATSLGSPNLDSHVSFLT